MKARELIQGATYEPDQVKVMGDALEAVWAMIATDVGSSPNSAEAARLRIARVILRLADDGILTQHELQEAAYRELFEPPTAL